MTPQQQSCKTDCFRTCLASLLDMDRDDVPDFVGDEDERGGEQWWIALGKWLADRGLAAISVHDKIGHALTVWGGETSTVGPPRGILHIASAMGPRGVRHAVVGRLDGDDEEISWHLVHDPHESGDGLAAEPPDRFYFLIPLDPAAIIQP